jgi:hypothetical protein
MDGSMTSRLGGCFLVGCEVEGRGTAGRDGSGFPRRGKASWFLAGMVSVSEDALGNTRCGLESRTGDEGSVGSSVAWDRFRGVDQYGNVGMTGLSCACFERRDNCSVAFTTVSGYIGAE